MALPTLNTDADPATNREAAEQLLAYTVGQAGGTAFLNEQHVPAILATIAYALLSLDEWGR